MTVAAAALAVAVPCAAAGRGGRAAALVGAGILAAAGVAAAAGAGAGPAAAALVPLAGFALLLAGAAAVLRALAAPPAAAAGLAALLGCALLALPVLGDALVEARGPGKSSPATVRALLSGSPLVASVGGGLGVDLLRTPRAYGTSTAGGLSRIGPFYPSGYPGPFPTGAAFAAAGGALILAARGLARRRPGP